MFGLTGCQLPSIQLICSVSKLAAVSILAARPRRKVPTQFLRAAVDTTHEAMEAFCEGELGVKGLPAFRFFSGGVEREDLRLMGYKKQGLEANLAKLGG